MKQLSVLILITLSSLVLSSQHEVELRTDGVVIPRIDNGTVSFPSSGQVIFDTNSNQLLYFDGSDWRHMGMWDSDGSKISYNQGNVGLGDSNPDEKLEVVGSVKASGSYRYSTNKIYHHFMHSSDFEPHSELDPSDIQRDLSFTWLNAGAIPAVLQLEASINLPDGAIIQELIVYYYDNVAFAGFDSATAFILGRPFFSLVSPVLGTVPFSTTNPFFSNSILSQSGSFNITLDNSTNAYSILLSASQTLGNNRELRFYGMKIKYELPTISSH